MPPNEAVANVPQRNPAFPAPSRGLLISIRSLSRWLLPAVALAGLAFGLYHTLTAPKDMSPLSPPGDPPRSPFTSTIAATGTVEPQMENIRIGSARAGVVLEVFVGDNRVGQPVSAGDPLFRVDDRQLVAELAVHEAGLTAARAELKRLEAMPRPEELPAAEQHVVAAQARLKQAEDRHDRAIRLIERAAIPEQELIEAREAQAVVAADLRAAEASLALLRAGAWEPDRLIAAARIAEVEAQIGLTRTEIERCLVRAPVAGEVLQVNVRPGEFVATPPASPLVVLGAEGSPNIRVDINEYDIPRFNPTASAVAIVRGGHSRIPLQFIRIEPYVVPKQDLSGNNTERVDTRVLKAIYRVDNQTGDHAGPAALYSGQQVDVFIEGAGQTAARTEPDSPGLDRQDGESF